MIIIMFQLNATFNCLLFVNNVNVSGNNLPFRLLIFFQFPHQDGDKELHDNNHHTTNNYFEGFDGDAVDNACHSINNHITTDNCIEVKSAIKNNVGFSLAHSSLNSESNDLLRRLMEKNPQHRLKSLLGLKRIAFYKNYNFDDVVKKKVIKGSCC